VSVPAQDAVVVAGLARRFGPLVALRDLSFTVGTGELFGVVGPDGAGKTTLLRILAGVVPPSAGDATIGGVSLARDPERAKPGLAYMSQRFGLYTDLTVAENLRFYADLFGVPRGEIPARLDRLYGFSGLGPFRQRLAGALSGGMRQKLALSCALVHRPPLLLLDEPTFGVDPISRRDLWLIVHEMVADGTTVIVSTAYLDEAERCDRVALLHAGRLVALDAPDAMQTDLDGRVLRVTGADPRQTVKALEARPGVTGAARFGAAVHVTTERVAERAAIERWLGEVGLAAATVEAHRASFEDVYLDAVRRQTAEDGARV